MSNRDNLKRIVLRAMHNAKPCPDGTRGMACPQCMGDEIVTQLLIAGTYVLGGEAVGDSVTKNAS